MRVSTVGAAVTAFLATASAIQLQEPLQDNAAKPARRLVDTEELQAKIHGSNLLAKAQDLYKLAELSWHEFNHPTRVIGSAGHVATLDYIYATLAKLGGYYNVSTQDFSTPIGQVFENRLVLGSEVVNSAIPMKFTPGTPRRQPVFGDLVLIEKTGCSATDYPKSVKDKIVLISRGDCAFGKISSLAGRAGAIATLIYNSENGTFYGTLGSPEKDQVPTFGLGREDALPYVEKLRAGKPVDGIAYIDAVVQNIASSNIIAQTVEGDAANCFMLGAHSDSVGAGPGINDDGSGTLSLLEVAIHLAEYSVNNCVRFAWWAAEEEGLIGSYYYAQSLTPEQNQEIRLFNDIDMMASPNYAYQIYNATNAEHPEGSEQLRDLFVDWYRSHNLNYTFIPFDGRSDYDGFLRAGIPAGGIATGAEGVKTKLEAIQFGGQAGAWYDPCYHQLCDDVGNVNVTAWEVNTKLIAHTVATFGRSFEGYPERKAVTASDAGSKAYGRKIKHRGNRVFI